MARQNEPGVDQKKTAQRRRMDVQSIPGQQNGNPGLLPVLAWKEPPNPKERTITAKYWR